MNAQSQIMLTAPSASVQVHLDDGRTLTGPRGTAIGDFLALVADSQAPLMGAIVNGELRELSYPIEIESRVTPITMATADGMRIYRRSLTFLLEAAFEDRYPGITLTVDHSVTSGGYFCQVEGRPPLDARELADLEAHMQTLVAADHPIRRERDVPLSQVIAYFQAKNYQDKVRLLAHRQKKSLSLYRLGEHSDYHFGYMVPSTGYLRWFKLSPIGDGFILRFPRRHRPTELLPIPGFPKLLSTFRLYGDWLERLGISDVGALNTAIQAGRINEIVMVSEALHDRHIAEIAAQIADRREQVRIILIAGPSSSGKTTFSRRLTIQLLAHGISPFPLEMDNYFVNRDATPRDENGNFDFESFDALDHRQLENDLQRLIAGERVQLPRYNFRNGCQEPGEEVQLFPGQMVILEGIHGLNPRLGEHIAASQTFRIYVSALTQLNLDRHNRISTTDTRLIRRIVRDARERGYSAEDTIQRWESVRRGEKRHIFPYQENADAMFNSALVFELAALKPLAEPLLRQVPYASPAHIEAKRLLSLLEWFRPMPADSIPENSILKEFLGGSSLRHFTLWRTT
ncbi:MAG: nucleoside kinase [Anaerolineales bacterium]